MTLLLTGLRLRVAGEDFPLEPLARMRAGLAWFSIPGISHAWRTSSSLNLFRMSQKKPDTGFRWSFNLSAHDLIDGEAQHPLGLL